MKFKSIELKNFRQFIDERIDFSMDKDKNITLVRGHNSGGKTTLANAITWCLYGKTNFKKDDDKIINKLVWQAEKPNSIVTTEVALEIIHSNREYRIVTKQDYKIMVGISAESKPRVQVHSLPVRTISYKDENGIKQQVPSDKVLETISEIVPQELSDYFFIKAEQMQGYVDNISTTNGKKFEEAVNKILGFDVIESSIIHMAEALKIFKNRFESGTNDKIPKLKEEIDYAEQRIKKLTENIQNYEKINADHELEIKDMIERIKEGEDGARDQRLLTKAQNDFNTYTNYAELNEKTLYKNFSDNLLQYLYASLLPEVKSKLSNANLSEKDVPDVTSTTIDFLLERHECICGHKFEEGSPEWQALNDLKNYVPPEYIGNAISRFIDSVKTREESVQKNDLNDLYTTFLERRQEYNGKIDDAKREIKTLSDKLKSYQSTEEFQKRKEVAEAKISENNREISKWRSLKELSIRDKKANEAELDRLLEQDRVNDIIRRRYNYLKRMHQKYQEYNVTNKKTLYNLLNKEVNNFFETVFSDSYKIDIAPNYAIKLVDNDGNTVGAGGAQTISTVLAFITSLLKLSQQIHYGNLSNVVNENGDCLLSAEPYPLVLDAPFSTFDEVRTSIVSPKLSSLTEQVIIFSKDPECKIIMDNAMDKIGKLYTLQFDTKEENGHEVVWSSHIVEGGANVN